MFSFPRFLKEGLRQWCVLILRRMLSSLNLSLAAANKTCQEKLHILYPSFPVLWSNSHKPQVVLVRENDQSLWSHFNLVLLTGMQELREIQAINLHKLFLAHRLAHRLSVSGAWFRLLLPVEIFCVASKLFCSQIGFTYRAQHSPSNGTDKLLDLLIPNRCSSRLTLQSSLCFCKTVFRDVVFTKLGKLGLEGISWIDEPSLL